MSLWKTARLDDVANIIMGQSPPGDTYNDVGHGLPFFQGKAEFGEVSPTPKRWCSSPLKIAEIGDILISVRAPVGLINLAPMECCIGRGLAAIRANQSKLDATYLKFMLRKAEPELASKAQASTSATIGQAELASICFPLPSLAEQSRAVDVLSRAEVIVQLCREAERKSTEMVAEIFLDMFGDPATNTMGWTTTSFGSVGTLDRGRSHHRPRDAQELYGGIYPFIQTDNVANSGGRITRYSDTYSELGLAQSRLWPKGTLCITIAANMVKTGILEFDACFSDSVIGFLPNEITRTEFVQAWLGFLQPMFEVNTPLAAKKNINLEILRNLQLPLPPLEHQLHFVRSVEQVRAIQAQQAAATAKAEETFDSLLAQISSTTGEEHRD